ncbi:hypothetical protein F5Y10DRAFT_87097 [Nemania abortiva]|nr:hypothetical protein F5Y10DRAFT_87097 [Nemania abortiva]
MAATKVRQPRLRASCDGCFLAKVKCSKSRPVCSRCLACGIVCNYSPSSRAGKPKPDNSHNAHPHPSPHEIQLRSFMDDKGLAYLQQRGPDHMYTADPSWTTTATNVENPMSRNASLPADLSLLGVNGNTFGQQDPMSAPLEMMPWTPSTDLSCTPFTEFPLGATHIQGPHARSQSFDGTAMPTQMPTQTAWGGDPNTRDAISYTQLQTPASLTPNYFPSPTATQISHPTQSCQQNGGSCTCFLTSVQSLLELHSLTIYSPPAFDITVAINQKAVDGCVTMLGCPSCLSRPGMDTSAMLIATILNQVASVAKSVNYSGAGSISFGTYQYQVPREGGEWIRTEIMIHELQKLEETFARFREIYAEVLNAPEFPNDLINYIGRNIRSSLDVATQRKNSESPSASCQAMEIKYGGQG